jgi:hypothetical protein
VRSVIQVFVRVFWVVTFVSIWPANPGLPSAGAAASKCPLGSTLVEDIATGKLRCEGRDRLDTGSIGSAQGAGESGGNPKNEAGIPGTPMTPKEPGTPQKPTQMLSKDSNCGLSRWGCEESCQKTYLSTATGPSDQASQRARVTLAACLQVCANEFSCPVQPPKTP